jgi:hypothetical protein
MTIAAGAASYAVLLLIASALAFLTAAVVRQAHRTVYTPVETSW